MFIFALLLVSLLCLPFETTRGFGLITLIVLCLLNPLLLIILMVIALGLYLYSKHHPKTNTTFLPKE